MARDTFDYGVLLYELITARGCGRRQGALTQGALALWAEPFLERLEQRLGAGAERGPHMVCHMLDVLAKECVQEDPLCRPSLKDLCLRLQGLQDSLALQ